jgi:ribosomal protein S12 methylthiotransferase accessory factor YcaO
MVAVTAMLHGLSEATESTVVAQYLSTSPEVTEVSVVVRPAMIVELILANAAPDVDL